MNKTLEELQVEAFDAAGDKNILEQHPETPYIIGQAVLERVLPNDMASLAE